MDIAFYSVKAVAYAITDPYLAILLVFLAFILYRQNKKTTVMQKMIIGESIDSPLELTVSQIVIGIFAGAIGAVILSCLGVIFDEQSCVDLIFLISIVLMFWNPRFMCFSYSASILGLFSLVLSGLSWLFHGTVLNFFGTNVDLSNLDFLKIDIVAVMTTVAVLHFIEGILVFIDGKRGAIPVFTNRDDKIIGGFAMQRYWIIPIAILILTRDKDLIMAGDQVATPNWWPLIHASIPMNIIKAATIIFYPIYGVIGYSSVTFTKSKQEKISYSGAAIIIYSLLLFGVAQLARLGVAFQLLAVIFAPAAHEFMIRYQRKVELKGEPKYVASDEGVLVLEVAPKSIAFQMGVRTGDIILEVNSQKINDENEMMKAISNASNYIWLKVKKSNGTILDCNSDALTSEKKLGVVYVPKNIPSEDMVVKIDSSKFQHVLNKIRKNNKNGETSLEDDNKLDEDHFDENNNHKDDEKPQEPSKLQEDNKDEDKESSSVHLEDDKVDNSDETEHKE